MNRPHLPDYAHNQDDEHRIYAILRQIIDGESEGAFASGFFDLLEHTTVRRSRSDVRKRQEAGERIMLGARRCSSRSAS